MYSYNHATQGMPSLLTTPLSERYNGMITELEATPKSKRLPSAEYPLFDGRDPTGLDTLSDSASSYETNPWEHIMGAELPRMLPHLTGSSSSAAELEP